MLRIVSSLFIIGLICSCGSNDNNGSPLTLAMEDEIITLDPYLHDDSITHSILSNIFEALVGFDNNMRLEPGLAIRWENPDDLTWKFYLRPDVYFHDGKRLTADDVRYSLERAKRGKVGHYISTVREIKIIDKMTIEIKTEKPIPILLNKLTFISIVPEGIENPIITPIGTGPYRFIRYDQASQIELRANQKYWRGAPAIKKAVIKMIPDENDRLKALTTGEVQLIREIDKRSVDNNRSNPDIQFISSPGLGVSMLGFNLKMKGPLQNRLVREAIYLAIDPVEAARESGWEAIPGDQLVSPYIVGYNPEISIKRPDTIKARELLRKAGYANGLHLELEMSKTAVATTGKILANQLGHVEIRIKPKEYDWVELSKRLAERKLMFFLIGWSCSSGDASDLFDACLHTPDEKSYGSSNWGNYSNKELDKIIEKSNQVLDNKERIELLKKAMTVAMADYPVVPLYARNRVYGLSPIIDFTPRQDGRIKVYEIKYKR